MIEFVAVVCYAALAVSAALCVARIARGPTLADRMLAVDCLLIAGVVGVGVDAAQTGRPTYLDVILIVTLVAFVGTTAVARFIERQGPP